MALRHRRRSRHCAIDDPRRSSLVGRPSSAPFLGCLGVAPAGWRGPHVRSVPGPFGGNMDNPEVRAGNTVYLGVNVPCGALLSFGDGHYAMGEGEIMGAAIEGAMNVELYVEIIKKRATPVPCIEYADEIMFVGSGRPLGRRGARRVQGNGRLGSADDRYVRPRRLSVRVAELARADHSARRSRVHGARQDREVAPSRRAPITRDRAAASAQLLRKECREHDIGCEDAAIVVAAFGNDHDAVFGAECLGDVFEERFAACATCWPLRHRVRRRIESAEWQHIHLAEEVGGRALDELHFFSLTDHRSSSRCSPSCGPPTQPASDCSWGLSSRRMART